MDEEGIKLMQPAIAHYLGQLGINTVAVEFVLQDGRGFYDVVDEDGDTYQVEPFLAVTRGS